MRVGQIKSLTRYFKTLLGRSMGPRIHREASDNSASEPPEDIPSNTGMDGRTVEQSQAQGIGLSGSHEKPAMGPIHSPSQGQEPDEENETLLEPSKVFDCKPFKSSGGKVLAPPNNVGHLSIVYDALRPRIVEMILPLLTWPSGNSLLRVDRTEWQGCALRWTSGERDPQAILHSEIALHIGGKAVNQDAVGMCEGHFILNDRQEPFAVIALADGVTTSLYSEFGALTAVATALRSCIEFLEAGAIHGGLPLPLPGPDAFFELLCRNFPNVRCFLRALQEQATKSLQAFVTSDCEQASPRALGEANQHLLKLRSPESEHMATTLIAACATREWFTVAGFGNGMVWVGFPSGDIAAPWQTDPSDRLDNYISTHRIPHRPTFVWTNPLADPGVITIGAATDGIPNSAVLRSAIQNYGLGAASAKLLKGIIRTQLQKCPQDTVDNATLARIDWRHADGEVQGVNTGRHE